MRSQFACLPDFYCENVTIPIDFLFRSGGGRKRQNRELERFIDYEIIYPMELDQEGQTYAAYTKF